MWRYVGLGALTLLAALLVAAGVRAFERSRLGHERYAVLPFWLDPGTEASPLTPDAAAALLHDALSRWEGIRLVDRARTADATARWGTSPRRLEDARAMARFLGATALVWGELRPGEHGVQVRAALYDPAGERAPRRSHSVWVSASLTDLGPRFVELADVLLLGRARARSALAGGMGTASVAAWQAFEEGRAALFAWDLPRAERSLRAAVWLDSSYTDAHLWLAQTMAWAGQPADQWRAIAARAAAGAAALPAHDRYLARGLDHMAEGRFQEACEEFLRLLSRDSLDFAAWFGLAECRAQDRLVVRDARSPSGWRFRSSYQGAIEAYRRALAIVPATHRAFSGRAYERLGAMLFTSTNALRLGFAPEPDTLWFASYPSHIGDTIAFIPHPLDAVLAARPGTIPTTLTEAVSLGRELRREVATQWVRSFPTSFEAHELLGRSLEDLAMLDDAPFTERSALSSMRRARALAGSSDDRLRISVAETRILLKRGQFAAAARLARETLREGREPSPGGAVELSAIALLTGRARRAADLLERSAPTYSPSTPEGRPLALPPAARRAGLRLMAFASLGAPRESIAALSASVDRLVSSEVPSASREAARFALRDVPARMSFADLGSSDIQRPAAAGHYLLELQYALTRGDTAAVRTRMDEVQALRVGTRLAPEGITADVTLDEARLLLALGDTTMATRLLDALLSALPRLPSTLTSLVPAAGGLVRTMELRTELAVQASDFDSARRWLGALQSLLSAADPEVYERVRRLRMAVERGARGHR